MNSEAPRTTEAKSSLEAESSLAQLRIQRAAQMGRASEPVPRLRMPQNRAELHSSIR